jgi:hypothetical protein
MRLVKKQSQTTASIFKNIIGPLFVLIIRNTIKTLLSWNMETKYDLRPIILFFPFKNLIL